MKRILLVLNEEHRRASAVKALILMHPAWDVIPVSSAEDALQWLAAEPVDIVVSDLSIRGGRETDFFAVLPATFADVALVITLEQEALETAARRAASASMYVCLPCSGEDIRDAVSRVVLLRDVMNGERVRNAVGRVKTLPSLPQIYNELMRLLRDPDAGAAEVAELVEQDMGMTAKILQMANSSYFALPREITNVRMAVTYIGFKLIQNLALSVTLFDQFDFSNRPPGFDPEEVQRHAFRTATTVFHLFKREPWRDDAFSAAMLHDVGKLVMSSELAEMAGRVRQRVAASGATVSAAEREVMGVDHAEIGGFLLMEWGLPIQVVEAVTYHHDPSRVTPVRMGVLTAVHLANALVGEWEVEAGRRDPVERSPLDDDFVDALGLADQLDGWRERVRDLCGEAASALVL